MNILFITDLYPIREEEKSTPRTLKNFVTDWKNEGYEVDVIKPNFLLNSFLRGKPFYKNGYYDGVLNLNYWTPFWFDVVKRVSWDGKKSCEADGAEHSGAKAAERIGMTADKSISCDGKKSCEADGAEHSGAKAAERIGMTADKSISCDGKKSCEADGAEYNVAEAAERIGMTADKSISCDGIKKYDVVVAHMPSGILFADKLNLPMVCAVHSSDIEVLTNPLYFLFKSGMEHVYTNARAIACRSYVLREKFLKIFPTFSDKTFVASSGTDAEIIKRDLDLSGEVKVVTCANLIKRKNVDKLIHAMKNLENFSLTVIGDGKMRKKWEKIDENVRFLGQLSHGDVLKEMKNSHIFVLPSESETFGMVYLEAMACGCITVCTKNDGIDGIIKDGENGFLTEPKIQNIRETLIKIKTLNDEQIEEISYNCHTTISEYSSKRCSNDYLQQILKII